MALKSNQLVIGNQYKLSGGVFSQAVVGGKVATLQTITVDDDPEFTHFNFDVEGSDQACAAYNIDDPQYYGTVTIDSVEEA